MTELPEPDIDPSPELELWDACSNHQLVKVKELLAKPKLNINWQDPMVQRTPFYRACGYAGDIETVKLLLADPRIQVNLETGEKSSPLLVACQTGHLDIVQLLLEDERVDGNAKDGDGYSPITFAAWFGNKKLVEMLLACPRVNINQPTRELSTALFIAVQKDHKDVVELLLSDPRTNVNAVHHLGDSPMHIGCQLGRYEIGKKLVSHSNINLNFANLSGITPLWISANTGHLQMVKLLFASNQLIATQKKSKLGQGIWNGRTPLEIATHRQHTEIVTLISQYERNSKNVRYRLRIEVGFNIYDAAEAFTLVVMLCDDYLLLSQRRGTEQQRRFFQIAIRLPLDIQMVLCNRLYSVAKTLISSSLVNCSLWHLSKTGF